MAAAETATDGALAALCAVAAARGLDVRAAWPPKSVQPAGGVPWSDAVEWEVPDDLSPAAKAEAIRLLRARAPFARVLLSAPDALDAPTRQPISALRQEALRLGGEDRGVDGLAAVVRLGSGGNSAQEWLTRLDEGAAVQGGGTSLTWHLTAVLPDASSPEAARRLLDFLHVAHGHPAVTGITLANVRGGPPTLEEAASGSGVRQAWNQLVGSTWNTRTNLPTSAQGIATTRVFRGEHDVAVEHAGARVVAATRVFADAKVRMVVPVVTPTLAAQAGGLIQFTWPVQAAGYVLESAPDPMQGPWTPCETFAVRGKAGWRQEHGASSAPRYFRLRRGGTP